MSGMKIRLGSEQISDREAAQLLGDGSNAAMRAA
jgi:hypothetical protein